MQLLELGSLEYLSKLISHEDKLVKRAAIMSVGTIASEPSARKLLRQLGSIKPLLSLLSLEGQNNFIVLLNYLSGLYKSERKRNNLT